MKIKIVAYPISDQKAAWHNKPNILVLSQLPSWDYIALAPRLITAYDNVMVLIKATVVSNWNMIRGWQITWNYVIPDTWSKSNTMGNFLRTNKMATFKLLSVLINSARYLTTTMHFAEICNNLNLKYFIKLYLLPEV